MPQPKESAQIVPFPQLRARRNPRISEESPSRSLIVYDQEAFESQDFSWLAEGEDAVYLPDLSVEHAHHAGVIIARVEHLPDVDFQYCVNVYDPTVRSLIPALASGDFAQACKCIRTYSDKARSELLDWKLDDLTGSFSHLARPVKKAKAKD